MNVATADIPGAILLGIGATLSMDVWNLLLKRALGIPSLNYCLLGRWFCYMPTGTFRHPNIGAASPRAHECTVGWMAHYTIGVTLALTFVVVFASADWLARPTLLPALLYGIGTVGFPLFIMQPSLGLGVASSRSPNPARARLKSLMTHSVFGLGLYLVALAATLGTACRLTRDCCRRTLRPMAASHAGGSANSSSTCSSRHPAGGRRWMRRGEVGLARGQHPTGAVTGTSVASPRALDRQSV